MMLFDGIFSTNNSQRYMSTIVNLFFSLLHPLSEPPTANTAQRAPLSSIEACLGMLRFTSRKTRDRSKVVGYHQAGQKKFGSFFSLEQWATNLLIKKLKANFLTVNKFGVKTTTITIGLHIYVKRAENGWMKLFLFNQLKNNFNVEQMIQPSKAHNEETLFYKQLAEAFSIKAAQTFTAGLFPSGLNRTERFETCFRTWSAWSSAFGTPVLPGLWRRFRVGMG